MAGMATTDFRAGERKPTNATVSAPVEIPRAQTFEIRGFPVTRDDARAIVQAVAVAEREMQCDAFAILFAKQLILHFGLKPDEFHEINCIAGRMFVTAFRDE